jgi:ABC-type transport system involved in cytochrome c biogenesis permease subunit
MDLFYLSETAFKAAVIFYILAIGLYLVYLARKTGGTGKAATAAAVTAVALHTVGLAFRWVQAGIEHPPFTNLYESLLFFSWGIAVFYLIIEYKYRFKAGGAFILPVALGAMGAAVLNPSSSKEIQDLMPALQSHWLHAHVAIAALAYGAFVAAFGASLMFMIKDGVPRKWLGLSANLFMAFMTLVSDRFNMLLHGYFTLNTVTADGRVTAELTELRAPGKLLLVAAIYFVIAAGLYWFRTDDDESKNAAILGLAYAPFVTLLGTLCAAIGLGALVRAAVTDPSLALFGNPFKIIILCLVIFVGGATVVTDLAIARIRGFLPDADKLDNMSYVIITIAFPLMTMVIVTGAVWAKHAFGHYWQWDPKETASLITWLIYTAYLHSRVSLNWPPRRVAAISILGFASVVFTYLGVNVIGPGYHAYASF